MTRLKLLVLILVAAPALTIGQQTSLLVDTETPDSTVSETINSSLLVEPESKPAAQNGESQRVITSSLEIGIRGLKLEGNQDRYKSDLNYRPGFRLFDSSFMVKSRNNDGNLFDTFLVNSSGWDGDPHGFLRINTEKTGIYRLDGNLRRVKYFNNIRTHALGQHVSDTRHKFGDFDLTLLPLNRNIKFLLGYSLDRNSGPLLNTYRYGADEFPIRGELRTKTDEYRIGADFRLLGLNISLIQGFREFREDTSYQIDSPETGNNVTGGGHINSLSRTLPYEGETRFTRLSIHKNAGIVDFTGRFVYSNTEVESSVLEEVRGRNQANVNIDLDRFTGTSRVERPGIRGDVGITLNLTEKLSLSDTVRYYGFHTDGYATLNELLLRSSLSGLPSPTQNINTNGFRHYGQNLLMNTAEFDYQMSRRFAFHIGHRYTDRHILLENYDVGVRIPQEPEREEFDFHSNTYFAGFKATPYKVWTMYLDVEKGRSSNVFTRMDNHDFTQIKFRNRLKPTNALSMEFSIVTKNNETPDALADTTARWFGVDTKSRNFSASMDWTPHTRFNLSSGYTYNHLNSDSAIIFVLGNARQNGLSRYYVRDHFAHISGYIRPLNRVALFASYRIQKDTGDSDPLPSPRTIFYSYPIQFQSPEFRLILTLRNGIDWNLGYQYFDYRDNFASTQSYRSHLPYTSLRFSF
jgi:hypothetical protein